MTEQALSSQAWRAVTLFCLTLLPAAAQILSAIPPMPVFAMISATVSAAILTATLTILLPSDDIPVRMLRILASVISMVLLPGFGITESLIQTVYSAEHPSPFMLAFCWIAGAILAWLSSAVRQVLSWQSSETSTALIRPVHLLFSLAVLTIGFWLIATANTTESMTPFSLQVIVLAAGLAFFSLSVTLIFNLGITIAGDRKEMAPADLTPLIITIGAVSGYSLAGRLSETPGASNAVLTVILVLSLMSVFLARRFAALLLSGALLLLSAPSLCQQLFVDPLGDPGLIALLISLPVSIMRTSRRSGGNLVRRAGDPPAAVLANYHKNSTSWLIQLDLEKHTVHFPHGSVFSAERGPPVGFNRVFQENGASGLLDLLRELHKAPHEATTPVRIQLQMKPVSEIRRQVNGGQLFEAHILAKNPPFAWLALFSLSHEKELALRAEKAEKLLSDAILREERLLSFAAHELRTPVAILSMLADELRGGALWADIREGFDQTLERITAILGDLRADSGSSSVPAHNQNFTPADLISQLIEVFSPVATTYGITLETSHADQAQLQMRGDFGRVFIALSKLLHNAITHSKASVVRLSVIVSRSSSTATSLSWQVSDNGTGIPEHERARIFEPFEAGPADAGIGGRNGHAGLGLYTARKAIRLLGGELTLLDSNQGSHFVLTHPARDAENISPTDATEAIAAGNPALWFNRKVLLIEDNRMVAEITRTRLSRIFHSVDWAETGPAGLEMWRQGQYDLVLIDQLLPGLTGCEVVRAIREADSSLPIIGITASTLGTECRDLEAAGVTIALEKPLSYAQIRNLAEEWFSPPSALQENADSKM
ncbi:response regulator [Xinfangfangia sp. D13-10-4-6]|uniref:ATP-binding response regulator n=1 Tax=Pseudogemmobacter hezensis TaxID=2737662 RepID=UPI0015532288|nr:hybrid sensor histidine kinase/response regulator [Pseudogemmobacter hezensis]NPD16970.1 response regulator [Pseudogemmobacter hezensis]